MFKTCNNIHNEPTRKHKKNTEGGVTKTNPDGWDNEIRDKRYCKVNICGYKRTFRYGGDNRNKRRYDISYRSNNGKLKRTKKGEGSYLMVLFVGCKWEQMGDSDLYMTYQLIQDEYNDTE